MIALRFVHLIEAHSDLLAENLLNKVRHSPRLSGFGRVPEMEIRERVFGIYRNLSDWLLNTTHADIERVYTHLGRRRAEQGVPLSAMCWALMLTEENLWEFLESEGMRESSLDILGNLELLRLLDQFYDNAIYYAIVGYEDHMREHRAEAIEQEFQHVV